MSAARIKHKDLVVSAALSVSSAVDIYDKGSIPPCLEVWFVAVPARRLLRGVYGSDLRAAWALLFHAVKEWVKHLPFSIRTFWLYTVLRRDQTADLDEAIKKLESEDIYDHDGGDHDNNGI